ncbi:hypothetical protein H5P28_11780 [Ruficoccus amylovorans]|uniref:DUF4926 domain-containing protein n=1 Tax=Ruficoccus amylovorans TaxID=1804625 RepID=A0A842HHB6_9BACT|nr:hypothetical protein [Ruficoccus amylovorans]MBC2594937.1 hypothetical protein [Ruficoccus amylovorans]
MKDLPEYHIGERVFHRAKGEPGVVIAIIDYGDHYRYRVAFEVKNGELDCVQTELTREQFEGAGSSAE